MAARIEADTDVKFGGLLGAEEGAYKDGNMKALITDAVLHYDTSADYWKLTSTGELKYDGDGWLKDEKDQYINKDGSKSSIAEIGKTIGSEGIETGLLEIFALEKTEKNTVAVEDMMVKAGLSHTVDIDNPNDRASWMWKGAGTENNSTITINQSFLADFGMVYLPQSEFTIAEQLSAMKFKSMATEHTSAADVQPGYPSWKNQQQGFNKLPGQTDDTWCNLVSARIDASYFGKGNSSSILSADGINGTTANQMGENLGKYYPQFSEGWMAQAFANAGYNTKISYLNSDPKNSGHIATIVANYGTYIPALGPLVSQGGTSNGLMYAGASQSFGSKLYQSNFYWMLSDHDLKKLRSVKK